MYLRYESKKTLLTVVLRQCEKRGRKNSSQAVLLPPFHQHTSACSKTMLAKPAKWPFFAIITIVEKTISTLVQRYVWAKCTEPAGPVKRCESDVLSQV